MCKQPLCKHITVRNMFCNRIHTSCLILVLAQYAQTFVLLTANIEDVKKLAGKFVSEPMALRIAEFISRASGQNVPTNVSKENEVNEVNEETLDVSGNEVNLDRSLLQGSSKRYRTLTRATTHQLLRKPGRIRSARAPIYDENHQSSLNENEKTPHPRQRHRVKPQQAAQNQVKIPTQQLEKHKQVQKQIQMQLEKSTTEAAFQQHNIDHIQQRQRPNRVHHRPRPSPRPRKRPVKEDQDFEHVQYQLTNAQKQKVNILRMEVPKKPNQEVNTVEKNLKSIENEVQEQQEAEDKQIEEENRKIEDQNRQYEPHQQEIADIAIKEDTNAAPSNSHKSEYQESPMILEMDNVMQDNKPETIPVVTNDQVDFIPVKRHRARARGRERFVLLDNKDNKDTTTNKPTMIIEFTSRVNGFNIVPKTTEKEKIEFDQYDNIRNGPNEGRKMETQNLWWRRAFPTDRDVSNTTVIPVTSNTSVTVKA